MEIHFRGGECMLLDQGAQSAPRYTAGSPGCQRRRNRWIGGCTITPSSSSESKSLCPRTAASCDVTASSDRPERSAAKMMCTTCFAANWGCGEIESTIATGPSTGSSSAMPTSSDSSRCRASVRLSPELTPPPGSSQYSPRPGFSCRQSRIRSSQRSSAETRTRGSAPITRPPSEGRAPEAAHAPLAVGELVDLDRLDPGNFEYDELRDPHAHLDDEGLVRVRVEQRDLQLAAIAGVDEPGRVHDR